MAVIFIETYAHAAHQPKFRPCVDDAGDKKGRGRGRAKAGRTTRKKCLGNYRSGFAVLAGHFELRVLVAVVGAEEQVQLPRLGVHRQSADKQRPHLPEDGDKQISSSCIQIYCYRTSIRGSPDYPPLTAPCSGSS
jgi:hypothetical protein